MLAGCKILDTKTPPWLSLILS